MIGWKDSALAFLSGHSHSKLPQTFHHTNGGIEILVLYSTFGLVTIDNNGISWSTIDIDNPPKGVITYPIPMNQISSNTYFITKRMQR